MSAAASGAGVLSVASPSTLPAAGGAVGWGGRSAGGGVGAGAGGGAGFDSVVSAGAGAGGGAVGGSAFVSLFVVSGGGAGAVSANAGCTEASPNAAVARKATPKRPMPETRFPLAANGVSSR